MCNLIKHDKSNLKRSLSYTPHNLPSVAELNPRNSIFSYLGPYGSIGHSSSTEAMAAIVMQSGDKGSLKKKCLSVWKQGLKLMPVFKIFDYQRNNMNDYNFFYDIIRKNGSKNEVLDELPDNFFEPEDFDLMKDMIDNNNNNNNLNSEKSLNPDIDESDFDEFDWSEPLF